MWDTTIGEQAGDEPPHNVARGFNNTSQVLSDAYDKKKHQLLGGLDKISLFVLFSTTTVSHTAGHVWLGTTFEVLLGHTAKERVAGVD